MDDVTLGKLTESHRGQADYCDPEGRCQSVSRRRLLCSIESRETCGEKEMSINQLVLVSRETRTVLTASFLTTPKAEKVVDRSGGNLRSEIAQMHRLGLYLKNRDK